MTQQFENIIKRIKLYNKSERFKKKYKLKNVKFKNDRKIRISTTIFGILSKVPVQSQFNFTAITKEDPEKRFGPLVMEQARAKLSAQAINELLFSISDDFPIPLTWKGFQVISLDGMEVTLPHLISINKNYYAMAIYDVLNQFFLCAAMPPSIMDRYKEVVPLIESLNPNKKQLLLLDKGFHSILLIRTLFESKKQFIIRASKSFLKEVNEFRCSDKAEAVIPIHYSKRRAHDAKLKADIPLPYDFTIRCIKLTRQRTPEILITNLTADQASKEELEEIFLIRWNPIRQIRILASVLAAEIFNGISENRIKQDFYASLLIHNFSLIEK